MQGKHPRCDADDAASEYKICRRWSQEDEDEQELFMLFMCYSDHVMRARLACAMACGAIESVVSAYVRYRGGMQEVRVFEIPDVRFQPDEICEKAFVHDFRFTHAQFDRVVLALLSMGIPSEIRSPARDKCKLPEALAMMCMKYAWPTRLGSMVKVFGTSMSRISRIVSTLRRLMYKSFGPALQRPRMLCEEELVRFSAAIERRCGQRNIFGFIDGTVRPMCKPEQLQAPCYTGKDKCHALKYQGLTTPDGLMLQLCGPWPGSRHDMHMLHKSELVTFVQSLPRPDNGDMFSVYADQGYAAGPGMKTPFFDGAVNAVHEAFNQAMSSGRICVEWAFGDILCYWASLDMKRQQQLFSNRKIAQVYLVAGILTNFMNCMKPNNTSQYFKLSPPCLEEYLTLLQRR
jgi:hypothetical protein